MNENNEIDPNRDFGGMCDSEEFENSKEEENYRRGLTGLALFAVLAFIAGLLALWHWKQ